MERKTIRINIIVLAFVVVMFMVALSCGIMHDTQAYAEDLDSGVYCGVDWRMTSSGELIIGKDGETQIFDDNDGYIDYALFARPFFSRRAWADYDTDKITSVFFKGKVVAREDMYGMFAGFSNLKKINFDNFDTSSVTDMGCMFEGCSSLTSLDLSNLDTSSVMDMSWMFEGCSSLTSLDLSNLDTSSVIDMSELFNGCSSLTSINFNNFDTSSVTEMSWMFEGCSSLTNLDLSNFDTSNVESMAGMFEYCSSLTSIDLSNFDTSKVDTMGGMFTGCSSLTSLNLSTFDTSSLTNMSHMFYDCSSMTSIDLSNFDTSNVERMGGTFGFCDSLTSLDLFIFDTSNVREIDEMFRGCSSLTSIDLSGFDLKNAYNASDLFYGCTNLEKLKTPINLSVGCELPHKMYDGSGKKYTSLPKNKDSMNLYKKKPGDNKGSSTKYTYTYNTAKKLKNIDPKAVSIISDTIGNKSYKAKKVGGKWCFIFQSGKKSVLISLSALKGQTDNKNRVSEINKNLSNDVIYGPTDSSKDMQPVFIETKVKKNTYHKKNGKKAKYSTYTWNLSCFEIYGNRDGAEIELQAELKNNISISFSERYKTTVGRKAIYYKPSSARGYKRCLKVKNTSKSFSPIFKVAVTTPGTNLVHLENCEYRGNGKLNQKLEDNVMKLINIAYTTGKIYTKMKVGDLPVSDVNKLFKSTVELNESGEGEYLNFKSIPLSKGKVKCLKGVFKSPVKLKNKNNYTKVIIKLKKEPSIDDKVPTKISVRFSYNPQ